MCFIVAVAVPKAEGPTVEGRLQGVGPLQVSPRAGALFSKRFFFEITEDGSCGCSMMDENAGTDPDLQRIRPDLLEPLAATLAELARVLPKTFELEAMWIGDRPRQTTPIQLTALLDSIRGNQLRDRTTYVVTVV